MARAHRVGRIIAAQYLSHSRQAFRHRRYLIRHITTDRAIEAFQDWDHHSRSRDWPKVELRIACDVAAALITGHPYAGSTSLLGQQLMQGLL